MSVVMQVWNDASQGRRIGVGIALLLVVALTVGAFVWLLSEEEAVLFSGLEERDAAAVVSELERMKVDYRLADGGTTILVPQEEVHSTRLKLTGSGVPLSGGVGFEVFDDADFGMTEFAQRINLQRALEGELTRTIMALEEIKYARVHLVMPENGLFKQSSREPTASVALFVKEGQVLNHDKVVGIQRLVAAAVPGLADGQVTVSDQNGKTLSRVIADEQGVGSISERLQKKAEVENYLANKAVDVLARTFGPNKALVSVDVVLDFDQIQKTREKVLAPAKGGQDAVVRRRESRSGNEADQGSGRNSSTEVEYKLGREVEQIVQAPGQIKRMSVGVIVPDTADKDAYAEIKQLVAMAVGLDEARGDAIGVYSAAPVIHSVTQPGEADQPLGAVRAERAIEQSSPLSMSEQVQAQGGQVNQWATGLTRLIRDNVVVAAGGLVVVALILLGLVYAKIKTGRAAHQRGLSTEEREQVLTQIRGWLEAEPKELSEAVVKQRGAQ